MYLMSRATLTLQPFANLVEVIAVGFAEQAKTLIPIFIAIAVMLAGLRAVILYVAKTKIPTSRIRVLMECTYAEAQQIHDYLEEIGVKWITYYRWVNGCQSRLMPVVYFDNGKNEQLVATWNESRRAMLKLSLERRLNPKWDVGDAVGAAGLEIIRERQSKKQRNIFMPEIDFGE